MFATWLIDIIDQALQICNFNRVKWKTEIYDVCFRKKKHDWLIEYFRAYASLLVRGQRQLW